MILRTFVPTNWDGGFFIYKRNHFIITYYLSLCNKMTKSIDIEQRKPIWKALSEFYLDTKLEDSDLKQIAITFLASPYSLNEVKAIDKYEVFPVLQANLNSIAGVWDGFDEAWLVNKITSRLNKQTWLDNLGLEVKYLMNSWMTNGYWRKVKKIYSEIK